MIGIFKRFDPMRQFSEETEKYRAQQDVIFLKQEIEAERRLHRETVTSLKAMTLNRDALLESLNAARFARDYLEKQVEKLGARNEDLQARVQSLGETVTRMENEAKDAALRKVIRPAVLHDGVEFGVSVETVTRLLKDRDDMRRRIAGHKEELDREADRVRAELGAAPILDPKGKLDAGNNAQAARAMSRQTKAAFVEYQKGVTFLLDRLNELGKKNHITKEDLRHFHDIRRDLSAQLQRTI